MSDLNYLTRRVDELEKKFERFENEQKQILSSVESESILEATSHEGYLQKPKETAEQKEKGRSGRYDFDLQGRELESSDLMGSDVCDLLFILQNNTQL